MPDYKRVLDCVAAIRRDRETSRTSDTLMRSDTLKKFNKTLIISKYIVLIKVILSGGYGKESDAGWQLGENAPERRGGRAVECTGLENRQTLTSLASSNLALSARPY
jgi:hypothetical protein